MAATSKTTRLLTPIAVPPVHQHVVDRLRRAIALGDYLPGERLPAERALAESMQVSRVAIREALGLLQDEGLLESRRGVKGGAIVLDPARDPEGRQRRLAELAPLMKTVHELRQAVEPMAARLAATRRNDTHLEAIEAANQALAASTNGSEFRQADSAFHLAVASASGNALLAEAIEDARSTMFSSYDTQGFDVLRNASYQGHLDVIRAVRAHDPAAASDAMHKHLDQAWREIAAEIARADAIAKPSTPPQPSLARVAGPRCIQQVPETVSKRPPD